LFSPHSKLFLNCSAMLEPQCSCFASLSSELEVLVNGQRLKRAPLCLMSVWSLLNTPVKSKGRETCVSCYSAELQQHSTAQKHRLAHAHSLPKQSGCQGDRCIRFNGLGDFTQVVHRHKKPQLALGQDE
ncbi:hypothetical protein ATANTOWER_028579, partial [Ataeniobius toweri]|nr:hypothetical protein [Ataeniobius toweri]